MPIKLSRPVTVRGWTFLGVDDWCAFCTDRRGQWFAFYTECSPCWPELPKCFIGDVGYPDTDEGVLATAILEARSGFLPKPCDPDCVPELVSLFSYKQ